MKKVLLALLLIVGCTQYQEVSQIGELELTSPAFNHNGIIPRKFTCKGEDVNPELNINNIPNRTKMLVLIMDDPDAPIGVWDHWITWFKPTSIIPEDSVPGSQGKNSWNRNDYGGPCPPSGTHHYVFKLYALDTELNLSEGASKEVVKTAMQGHIIAQTQLIGLVNA